MCYDSMNENVMRRENPFYNEDKMKCYEMSSIISLKIILRVYTM